MALGRELGLRVSEPRVLGTVPNAVVHLAPSPVVARVPTAFASVPRGPEWVDRQLSVARHLVERGVPVVAPTALIPAGPHERDGLVLGLWEHVDHDPTRPLDVRRAVVGLLAMQDALVSYTGALPHFARLDELAQVLEIIAHRRLVTDAQLDLLRGVHAALARALPDLDVPLQPVHGDSHLGNVLRTRQGPLWTDFDTVCSGPRELDLLSLSLRARLHRDDPHLPTALDAYGPYSRDVAAAVEPYLALYLCCWTAACIANVPAVRPLFEQRLAWVEGAGRYAREM